jgi:hypothetical protein
MGMALCFLGGNMKKAKKRAAKSSSKRAAAKASKRGSAGRKKVTKTKKRSATASKVKRTAKKVVKEAAVAAGLAAVGTVLTELGAGEKKPTSKRSDAEEKH